MRIEAGRSGTERTDTEMFASRTTAAGIAGRNVVRTCRHHGGTGHVDGDPIEMKLTEPGSIEAVDD